jgi:hypothetical protein
VTGGAVRSGVAGASLLPGMLGCGGDSGCGRMAPPRAGVTTAQGLVGLQLALLGETELSGGDTAATVRDGRTCANAGAITSAALKATRQAASLKRSFPVF